MKNSQILERKIKKNIYIGIGPQDLLDDLNTMEFLFKNLCIRDLRIYADFLDGTIYHYRYRYNTYEKKTSFLLILCANAPYAYKRKDGIYVVPITKLKP